MNKYFFLWAVAALTLSSCSDDDEPTAERYPLTIAVSENPLLDEAGNPVTTTRGTVITTGTLASFYANYQDTKYTATKSSEGTWSTSPSYWPTTDYEAKIDFYAYSAGTFYNEGSPYVSFTVETFVSSQKDLLVAHRNVSYNKTSGKVWLTFDHACAAVDFQVQITNALYSKLNNSDLTVNSISLQGIANIGQYYYSTGWTTPTGSANYSLNNSAKTVTTTPQATNNGTLFMIPQTLGDNAKLVVNYKKSSDVDAKTAEISLKGRTWEAGKQYIVTIKLGTGLIK